MRLRLMPKLLALFFVVALIPLIVLEVDAQLKLQSATNVIMQQSDPQTIEQAKALLQQQQQSFWAAAVVMIGLSCIIMLILDRSIVQPIYQLHAIVQKLLSGEFPTFKLKGAADELSDLAVALSEMSTNLHALVIEAELHGKDMEQLYQETRRRATALQTIHSASQRISTILDLDDLLPKITKLIRDGFDYDRVCLFTMNQATNRLVFRTGASRAGRVAAEIGERIPINPDSTIGQVAETGQPLIVQDKAFAPSKYTLAKMRSELAVPLLHGEQVLGVLYVQSDHANAFDKDDLFVVQEVAAQAASAMVNAQLYEEAFNHAQEVMTLLITSVAVSAAPDLAVRLEAIAHHARQSMDADGCTVFRLDAQSNLLRPLISLDPHSEQMMAMRIPAGQGITGRVIQSGQGTIVNHAQNDASSILVPGTPEEPECVLALPLTVSDRTIGAMTVHRLGHNEFKSHDLELMTMFASQAAVAIENAELYQQLKERAESLQRAYKELEEADRVKDEMIQNISHELRTPLTFMIGYLGLVLDGDMGPLTQSQQEGLRVVFQKTQALTHLVDNIITLQTIRITKPEFAPMDITTLAQRAIDVAEPAAKRANIQLAAEIPAASIYINGEQARLGQVFDNLLDNAIKFSPDGGTITLRIKELDEKAQIEIQDTGIGIPQDKLGRIFERFYQVDGTATRRFGGIGMGLAICKEIIKAHEGQIWAESPSPQGHGSIFYFTLEKTVYEYPTQAE